MKKITLRELLYVIIVTIVLTIATYAVLIGCMYWIPEISVLLGLVLAYSIGYFADLLMHP